MLGYVSKILYIYYRTVVRHESCVHLPTRREHYNKCIAGNSELHTTILTFLKAAYLFNI